MNGLYPVLTFAQTIAYIKSLPVNYNTTGNQLGVSLKIENAAWYNTTYKFDLIALTMSTLKTLGIENVANATTQGIPVIIQSTSMTTLKEFKKLTDLPLVQTMSLNQTWSFADVAAYAHGVQPSLELVVYYP